MSRHRGRKLFFCLSFGGGWVAGVLSWILIPEERGEREREREKRREKNNSIGSSLQHCCVTAQKLGVLFVQTHACTSIPTTTCSTYLHYNHHSPDIRSARASGLPCAWTRILFCPVWSRSWALRGAPLRGSRGGWLRLFMCKRKDRPFMMPV